MKICIGVPQTHQPITQLQNAVSKFNRLASGPPDGDPCHIRVQAAGWNENCKR
jgi:hypothetical protein